MLDLANHDALYLALLNRDDRYDGRAFVCVATTGIFCRLTCPARKPRPENCTFRATARECIAAGFRACLRCHPLRAATLADPVVAALLAVLDDHPDLRWSERHVVEMGFDPSTVRRSFLRHYGMTFLDLARQRRLRDGFEALSRGAKVITAQHQASFDSPSAFREAFARLLGCAPAALVSDAPLRADWIVTPLGDMLAVGSATHLHLLEFLDRRGLADDLGRLRARTPGGIGIGRTASTMQARAELAAFFSGRSAAFDTPLAVHAGLFTTLVWDELHRIPAGETRSYAEIARRIGRPTAVRAVARANAANRIALMIPCHRVIGTKGALTGYGGGLWRKQRLIEIERQFHSDAEVACDVASR